MSPEFYTAAVTGAVGLAAVTVLLARLYLSKLVDRRIASYQKDLVAKHYDEVQNMYRQMRGWRHDYHNHIQTMKAYLALSKTGELVEYLNKLDTDLASVDTVIKTGNIMADAILNSKLSLAASKNIRINVRANVPAELKISEIDLCIIIGNLLDNAAEACMKQENEADRFIRVYIGLFKEQLYISVSNSTGGRAIRQGKTYPTSKAGFHGFGLNRIDHTVKKYNGYVNRQNEEGVFATEVMLPM